MRDLKALVKGLISVYIDYHNHQCPPLEENRPPFSISNRDKKKMVSDAYLESNNIQAMLNLKLEELSTNDVVSHRIDTLKLLCELIVRLNNNLNDPSSVQWDSEKRRVSKLLCELYKLKELPVNKIKKLKVFDITYQLQSTQATNIEYNLYFFKGSVPQFRAGEFAQKLNNRIFRPLCGELFDQDKSVAARTELIESKLAGLFVPFLAGSARAAHREESVETVAKEHAEQKEDSLLGEEEDFEGQVEQRPFYTFFPPQVQRTFVYVSESLQPYLGFKPW